MTNREKQTEVSTIKLYVGPKNKTKKNNKHKTDKVSHKEPDNAIIPNIWPKKDRKKRE